MGAEVGIASLIMGVTFLGVFFSAHIVLLDQIDVVTDVAEERTAALPILEFVNLSTDDEALLDLASFSGSNWDTTADGPYDVEVNHATGSGGIVTITVASGIFTDMTVKVRGSGYTSVGTTLDLAGGGITSSGSGTSAHSFNVGAVLYGNLTLGGSVPVEAVDLGLTVDDATSDPVTYHFETDVAWLTGGPSSDPTYVYPGDVFPFEWWRAGSPDFERVHLSANGASVTREVA